MRTAHPAGPALARALLLGMLAFPWSCLRRQQSRRPSRGEKVDINTADEAALAAALKGVGRGRPRPSSNTESSMGLSHHR